ncbi:Ohr family peroxiredoxin [Pseudoduganella eburnea]|uniref:Ohr family peroxiredoxin n=1 Tax=Massilia eburnea TaxID=1776165 RepID=A0A6L6QF35_9BURK|nr:Ohr family peroxiredoxin [Massilia eburnea]MTW10720.1 Ohr family peroxiredoxin [Massilia eburnea]
MSVNNDVLYTGKTHITGGRNGFARSDDGQLDIKLSRPASKDPGTNPEQLLGAGWSACFIGAIGIAAAANKLAVPADISVDAEIDLCKTDAKGYFLQARLRVSLPGMEAAAAEELVSAAHQTCPYSKALHGNVAIATTVVV